MMQDYYTYFSKQIMLLVRRVTELLRNAIILFVATFSALFSRSLDALSTFVAESLTFVAGIVTPFLTQMLVAVQAVIGSALNTLSQLVGTSLSTVAQTALAMLQAILATISGMSGNLINAFSLREILEDYYKYREESQKIAKGDNAAVASNAHVTKPITLPPSA
jgi:ABC-type multidrug transport system fused ATPase/permease subunit